MTVAPYFSADGARYSNPTGLGTLFVGNMEHFAYANNATRIAWTKAPTIPIESFRHLHLAPTRTQLGDARFPEYVAKMAALEALTIPYPYLSRLEDSGVIPRLRSLSITYDESCAAFDPRSVRWPDVVAPTLTALYFSDGVSVAVPWAELGLAAKFVPSLECFRGGIDKKGAPLDLVATFKGLRHAEIYRPGNHDVFGRLPKGAEYVYLNRTGLKFPFGAVSGLRGLKGLFLVGIQSEIDCDLLAGLPDLVELCVHNTRKIRGVASLLNSTSLRSLEFVNCGGAFDRTLKPQFLARGYEHLNINYS